MSDPEKPTRRPREIWKALEDQAASDEMDRILSLDDRALDEELAGLGFDPEAERARGVSMGGKAIEAAKQRGLRGVDRLDAKRRLRRRSVVNRFVFSLAAALAVGLACVFFVTPLWIVPTPVGQPPGAGDGAAPTVTPQAMRRAAFIACEHGNWTECAEGLDRAREVDPAGEARGDVQAWRQVARMAVGGEAGAGIGWDAGR